MSTAFLTHPACGAHDMGPGHPESPARLVAIRAALQAAGLLDHLRHYPAPLATRAQLERVHGAAHVDYLFGLSPTSGVEFIDGDTVMTPATLEAALRAAGAVVMATDLVLGGAVVRAFCSIRPPGHHAERDTAMGFCFFNNIAVGAAHALAAGIARVAVLDFDVHHGNGTEDIFANDDRVLFCSTFQHPLYPHRARDNVQGRRVNTPLPAGTASPAFRSAVLRDWLPALDAFRPGLIFISAGFDAHREDPLGGLQLDDADYEWVTAKLVEVADRHCGGRIVSALEGGYHLKALGRSAAAHVRALLGAGVTFSVPEPKT
jgi:acetoin utilization deacetylase AcuC-like enzyme